MSSLLLIAVLAVARVQPEGRLMTSAWIAATLLTSVIPVSWLAGHARERRRLSSREWLVGIVIGYAIVLARAAWTLL